MKPEPSPHYAIEEDGPFRRARVRVYGRTEAAALEAGRELRAGLSKALSNESTCYTPGYGGFDPEVRRHYSVVVAALGGDRGTEEQKLDSFLRQLSSSSK